MDNNVLRERISLLGPFLGDAISRQTGEQTLDTIETLRKGFIQQRRAPNEANKQQLIDFIASLDNKTLKNVIRSFSIYFFLANLTILYQKRLVFGIKKPLSIMIAVCKYIYS